MGEHILFGVFQVNVSEEYMNGVAHKIFRHLGSFLFRPKKNPKPYNLLGPETDRENA